jgi:hypothetical protein
MFVFIVPYSCFVSCTKEKKTKTKTKRKKYKNKKTKKKREKKEEKKGVIEATDTHSPCLSKLIFS